MLKYNASGLKVINYMIDAEIILNKYPTILAAQLTHRHKHESSVLSMAKPCYSNMLEFGVPSLLHLHLALYFPSALATSQIL